MTREYLPVAVILLAASLAVVMPSHAETTGSGESDAEAVAKKLSNPVSDMVSVPLQFNWISGNGPEQDLRFVMNFQPVVPFAISDKWNLIGRWIMPYESSPRAWARLPASATSRCRRSSRRAHPPASSGERAPSSSSQ